MRQVIAAGAALILGALINVSVPAQEDGPEPGDETAATADANADPIIPEAGVDEAEPDCIAQAEAVDAPCPTETPAAGDASDAAAEDASDEPSSGPVSEDDVSGASSADNTASSSTTDKPSAWVPPDLFRPFDPGR